MGLRRSLAIQSIPDEKRSGLRRSLAIQLIFSKTWRGTPCREERSAPPAWAHPMPVHQPFPVKRYP